MSLSKVQLFLHRKDPSTRLHLLALDVDNHTYFKVLISNPKEIIDRGNERNYKSLKNSFMIFKIDCSEAFKVAKMNKKFRQHSESFKDFSLLWNISSREIKEEYENIFIGYKDLLPKALNFISCIPRVNTTECVSLDHISTFQPEVTLDTLSEISSYAMGENESLLGYMHYDHNIPTQMIQTPVPVINQLDWYGSPHDMLNLPLFNELYTQNFEEDQIQMTSSAAFLFAWSSITGITNDLTVANTTRTEEGYEVINKTEAVYEKAKEGCEPILEKATKRLGELRLIKESQPDD
ncbi:15678_t:CDS:2 [Funneliformis geosporum]|uniref:16489_t:CDS:1 n=1 Tax=Funneliformis geosporum TaxID=1117311 RepID=A0A9W4X1A8_9GLOM|nr:15678_t:CDS:2 [Funneliformis geosporum]CAI2179099.1 16489_t:CDS:2 [Funneliformis geosporum]